MRYRSPGTEQEIDPGTAGLPSCHPCPGTSGRPHPMALRNMASHLASHPSLDRIPGVRHRPPTPENRMECTWCGKIQLGKENKLEFRGLQLTMPKRRLELPRCLHHMNLNHARLPVPPLGQGDLLEPLLEISGTGLSRVGNRCGLPGRDIAGRGYPSTPNNWDGMQGQGWRRSPTGFSRRYCPLR